MDRKQILTLTETGTTVERILAEVWRDADNEEWPKENAGQRKALVELAFTELKGE